MPQAVLAAAPILAVLGLMLLAGWSAARAGLAGLALALVVAVAGFGLGADGLLRPLAGVLAEAGFLTAGILWILWPALALHQLQQHTGALDALRGRLARWSPRPLPQALLLGWCVALFLEGAAGFGTPVALAAPLLVGLGVPALQAVVLGLLGHAAGVAFGALGTPLATSAALTGLDPGALGGTTALLNLATIGLAMLFFLRVLRGADPAFGVAAAPDGARWAALAALAFALPATLIALALGPELPTLGGALLGGAALAWALRRAGAGAGPGGAGHEAAAPGPRAALAPATPPGPSAWRALAPYGVLVALVLATRLPPAVAGALGEIEIGWTLWERYEGRIRPLLHPGTLLLAALALGALLQPGAPRRLAPALVASARRLLPVALALLAMLCLSRLMLHAGMVASLQAAAVESVGRAWPLLAPAVGALGSFVTGSATASNVLFASLQAQTAQALDLDTTWIVAGQGIGAAIGNIVCPHNVVAGAATVGLAGREAEILRRTLPACLAVLLAVGALLAGLTLAT